MKGNANNTPGDLAAIVKAGHASRIARLRLMLGVGALVVLAAGWLWFRQRGGDANRPPSFVTQALRRGDLSLTITATGNLEPTNQITVGSELSGTVQAVYVDINDKVTKGQPLAQLDTTKLRQQIDSSRAAVESAKAKVAQSEATVRESGAALKRDEELRRLSGGKVPAQADMDAAQATSDRALADLESAKAAAAQAAAQLAIDENNLSKAVIRSPVDGIVLTRSVDPGQTVAASLNAPELFVIAEKLERMKLKISVAEADIGRVAAGLPASFTVDAWPDRTYSAEVLRVAYGSSVTNNVVTYETDLSVVNDDLSLRPGMTATADICVAQRKGVLLVPAAALRFSPPRPPAEGTAVAKKSFMQSILPMPPRPSGAKPVASGEKAAPGTGRLWVLRNGMPEPVDVRVGLSDGRFTEVTAEGLQPGAPVVLRANGGSS